MLHRSGSPIRSDAKSEISISRLNGEKGAGLLISGRRRGDPHGNSFEPKLRRFGLPMLLVLIVYPAKKESLIKWLRVFFGDGQE